MFNGISKPTRVWLAFASVYLFWGSTYLAIHVAGEHLPTPVVSGMRSLVSAVLIFLICGVRRISLRVPKDEIWKLVVVGILFMSVNNMGLTWGEKMVPSGFASLVISTMPILIALLERGSTSAAGPGRCWGRWALGCWCGRR
jgi:drug/metabolite transporter (DMT)-like permease